MLRRPNWTGGKHQLEVVIINARALPVYGVLCAQCNCQPKTRNVAWMQLLRQTRENLGVTPYIAISRWYTRRESWPNASGNTNIWTQNTHTLTNIHFSMFAILTHMLAPAFDYRHDPLEAGEGWAHQPRKRCGEHDGDFCWFYYYHTLAISTWIPFGRPHHCKVYQQVLIAQYTFDGRTCSQYVRCEKREGGGGHHCFVLSKEFYVE